MYRSGFAPISNHAKLLNSLMRDYEFMTIMSPCGFFLGPKKKKRKEGLNGQENEDKVILALVITYISYMNTTWNPFRSPMSIQFPVQLIFHLCIPF